jgi:methylmalonyl-CoA mutase C-terminal domain/subunit
MDVHVIYPPSNQHNGHDGATTISNRPPTAQAANRAVATMKILVAKPGLDGHDRGAKVVVQALRDAGMEVVYSGLKRTPDEIVAEAIQEDVDVVGLSILSGAHLTLAKRVVDGLRARGADDVRVVVGGIVPPRDVEALRALGVERVFPMGTALPEIVRAFKESR